MEITPELTTFSILAFGFVLGLRHATEADHLAAVSTIVSERKSLFSASIIGGMWGVGHTISLFFVGLVVILAKLQISESVEANLEAVVGVMLVLLGANALRKLLQAKKIHAHSHDHDGHPHTHIHTHVDEKAEASHHRFSPRSVIVGMIHGLAGSGALMFIILPLISSPFVAMAYILVFGIGSIGGMMVMSFLIGLPFHFTADRFDLLNKGIRLCSGVFSIGLGAYIVYEKLLQA
jgi:sulfite exporter TauE/SafE